MLAYYGVIGYLIRGNPIAYGKIDNILELMANSRQSEPQQLRKFFDSFTKNMGMTLPTMFIILSDQFEWR